MQSGICQQCGLDVSSRVKANMMVIYDNIRLKLSEKKLEATLKETSKSTKNLKEILEATISKNNELETTIQTLEQQISEMSNKRGRKGTKPQNMDLCESSYFDDKKNLIFERDDVYPPTPFLFHDNDSVTSNFFITLDAGSNSSEEIEKSSLDVQIMRILNTSDINAHAFKENDSETNTYDAVSLLNDPEELERSHDDRNPQLFNIIRQLCTQQQVSKEIIRRQKILISSSESKYAYILRILNQIKKNFDEMQLLMADSCNEKEQYREELDELLNSFIEIEEELITYRNENQFKDEKINELNENVSQNSVEIKKLQYENDVLKSKLDVASSNFMNNGHNPRILCQCNNINDSTKSQDSLNYRQATATVCTASYFMNSLNDLKNTKINSYPLTSTACKKKKTQFGKNYIENFPLKVIHSLGRNLKKSCAGTYFAEQFEIINVSIQNLLLKKTSNLGKYDDVDMLRIYLRLKVLIELMTKNQNCEKEHLEEQCVTSPKGIDITQLFEAAKRIYMNYK